ISELEGHRRGPYAGAVGYFLPDGPLDTCIAIRTILLHGGVAYLQAGAGIVADSSPSSEHDECLRKLAALERAIELAEGRAASSGAAGGAGPGGARRRGAGRGGAGARGGGGGGGGGGPPGGAPRRARETSRARDPAR